MIIAKGRFESGDYTLTIEAGSRDYIAELLNVGSLDIELDLTPDQAQMESVRSNYGSLSVQMHLYDRTGADLQGVFLAEYEQRGNTRGIEAQLTIQPFGLEPLRFNLLLQQGNISANDFEQTIDIQLDQFVDELYSMRELFDFVAENHASDLVEFKQVDTEGTERVFRALHIREFVKYGMQKIYRTDPNEFSFQWDVRAPYFGSITNTVERAKFFIVDIDDPIDGQALRDEDDLVVGRGRISFSTDSNKVFGSDEGFFDWAGLFIVDEFGNVLEQVREGTFGSDFVEQNFANGAVIRAGNVNIGTIASIQDYRELTLTANANESVETVTGDFRNSRGQDLSGTFPIPVPYTVTREQSFGATPVLDIITSLASGAGCVFGCGFSVNYFAERFFGAEQAEVSLPLDDYEALEFVPRAPFVNGVFVSQIAANADLIIEGQEQQIIPRFGYSNFGTLTPQSYKMPNLRTQRAFTIVNPYAERDLVIDLAPAYPFMNKAIWDGTDAIGFQNEELETDFKGFPSIEVDLVEDAVRSYAKALTEPTAVRFTVFGASKIKPFSIIKFEDPRIPSKYGLFRYRVTSVKYDFINDIVECEAYAIDNVENEPITPPPPGPPTPGDPVDPIPPLPGVPALQAPADGDTDVTRMPTFIWKHPTTGGQVLSYDLLLNLDGAGFFVFDNTGTATQYQPPFNLEANSPYQWRVRANGVTGSTLSAIRSFTTGTSDTPGPAPEPPEPQPVRPQPPRKLVAGRNIDPVLGTKRLSDVLLPDGKVRKSVLVEQGGDDGTLSKRISGLTAKGQYAIDQMYEKSPIIEEPIRVELQDGRLLIHNIATDEKFVIGYRAVDQDLPVLLADDTAPGTSGANSVQLTRELLAFSTLAGKLARFSPEQARWDGDTIQPFIDLDSATAPVNSLTIPAGTNFTIDITSLTQSGELRGMSGGVNGRTVKLINRGTVRADIIKDSGDAPTGQKFYYCKNQLRLTQGQVATFVYMDAIPGNGGEGGWKLTSVCTE